MKPETRETVLPKVEYNVLNMEAPAGYFVPGESTINGYNNGHNKVSAPNGATKNVGSEGYVETFSDDPGELLPDGTIDRDTCGVGDDLGRFECESILFPLDTNLGGGQGSNALGNESGIHQSDEIVMYYPEALEINGRLFDVKSTYSNFVKTSDSQGGDEGGWYTTFAVSHYFYDGYWLVDFQSVQQELEITDSESGNALNLSDMKVYDFRFGMQSLNASGADVAGEYTAEALQPYFGIDESTAEPTCDIEQKYNYTLDAVAWEGTSDAECNGVSFNTTDTNTIEFRVAKNPSEADSWGNNYWEIAWFVPIFWATSLPTNFTDAGDAPESYGNGEIQLDGDMTISKGEEGGEDIVTIDRDDQFYLGDSNPLNDMQNDNYGHSDGLNDDANPTGVENFDDETSLDAYLDEGSEVINFRLKGSTIDLEIPYTNEIGYDGQIVVWIDFDDNGSFDKDEATAVPISAGSGVVDVKVNIPDDAKNSDTYMRVVMNSKSLDSDGKPTGELEDITGNGNAAVFPGLGETEDYPVKIELPAIQDQGDAPLSYGIGAIDIDTSFDRKTNTGFYLGFDPAHFDSATEAMPETDTHEHVDGLGDDTTQNEPDVDSYDDESGFLYHVQGPDGYIDFNREYKTVNLTVPYENTSGLDGQIVIWIDFDANGKFDEDEGFSQPITQSSGDSDNYTGGQDNFYRNSVTFNIPVPSDVVEGETYMRAVLTSDTSDILDQGNADEFEGIGEVEDYPVRFILPNTTCSSVTSLSNPELVYDEFERVNDLEVIYKGVQNPYWGDLDIYVTAEILENDPDDKPIGLVDSSNYPLKPGAVYTVLNGFGWKGEIKINVDIYSAGTKTPAELPLQFTTFDLDRTDKSYEWIREIDPITNVWGESDNYYDFGDGTSITPSMPPYHNISQNGSQSKATWVTPFDSHFEYIYDSGTMGAMATVISFPSIYTEYPECPTPDVSIDKKANYEEEDHLITTGDTINYSIELNNSGTGNAYDVIVRDSLVEGIVSGDITYLELTNVTIDPSDRAFSGEFGNVDDPLTLSYIGIDETVTISYDIEVKSIPSDISELVNVVTDDGSDPIECTEANNGEICDEVTLPVAGNTIIAKEITAESNDPADGIAEQGEEVTYKITITNPTAADAINVPVRDSVLEVVDTTDWLTLKDDAIIITPDTTVTTGDITNGDFVIETVPADSSVTLEYTLVFGEYPNDVEFVENWATDTDQDPTVCTEENEDCAEAIIDTNAPTEIEKKLIDESYDVNGIVEDDEDLTYQLTITNSTDRDAINVAVRDNLLEDLPSFFTWDGTFTIDPTDTSYTGDLGLGTFVIDTIPAGESVTITYTLNGSTIPDGISFVANIVTNDGKDPVFPCLPTSDTCDIVINPIEPETVIKKSVEDTSGDKIAQVGETLTFTIEVQNPTNVDAPNTIVRDSLLESLPTYLTFNNDIVLTDSEGNTLTVDPGDLTGDYSGNLTDGNGIDIFDIPGHSSVFITYSVTVNEIPNDVSEVVNIVTDDETDPTTCTEISTDCAGTITPVDPETVIEKSTNLADGEAVAIGDQIEYTITVTNPNTEVPALKVNVQDSLVQNMPSYLTLVSGAIDPTDTAYSGLLSSGNITIASIEPGASVSITYVVEVTDIPSDVESIINIATDDGVDPNTLTPEICTTDSDDCATTTTPVDPETLIEKSALDSEGNEFNSTNPVQEGEDVYYTISVTNPGSNSALDVNVIDTLVDQITPSLVARILGSNDNFTYNDDMQLILDAVTLVNPDDYTGDLSSADVVINSIPAGKTVDITFSIHVDSLEGITEITNVVTDNGEEVEACTDLSADDCDSVTIPVNPKTEIEKSVTESIVDGYATVGEEITYSIDVTNSSDLTALNVVVKDSLLANLPAYLEQVGTVTVDPTDTVVGGDLTTVDGMTISEIPAGETVTISYTLKLISNPDDGEVSLINLATDDGTDPETLTPEICTTDSDDCDSTELPVDADTIVRKDLITQSGDDNGSIENGELLTYQISVNNSGSSAAVDVQVIDSLLSALPSWLTLEGAVVVEPETIEYGGDLTTSTGITITEIPAGETVTITYNLRVGVIPNDVESLINLVSDNGEDPTTITPELCVPGSDLADGDYADDCSSTITPIHPETVISKAVDTGDDEYISVGEEVFYTITITNPSIVAATDVNVKDNLYSDLPGYLEISTPFTVSSDAFFKNLFRSTAYTGDLVNPEGITLEEVSPAETITITYGLTLTSVPVTGDGLVKNIATDDGSDPDTCTEVSDDCAGTITPIDADTIISKELFSEDGELDGLAESGETLTFKLTVQNVTAAPAENVVVRDSIAELASAIDWITFNGIIATNPEVLSTTGSLETGDYTISEILAHSTVSIFYTITIDEIPSDISSIGNIATDNGQDPTDPDLICEDNPKDCDEVITPVNPDTIINKTATTDSGDLVVTEGETINYTITVNNPSTVPANSTQVIDSLLSNLPAYVTFNDDIVIANGTGDLVLDEDYTGDLLTTDGIVIDEILAGDTVTITYSITLDEVPADGVVNIRNVVTDNGDDPTTITPEVDCDEDGDCGQVIIPIDPETTITKEITNESIENDYMAQNGEEITYQLTVSNLTDALALDVEVKDSLLEGMPEWITLVGDVAIEATPTYTMETTGDLQTGDFVITEIPAKTVVTITYTVLIGEIPDGTVEIPNVATDNGDDPDTIDPELCNPTVDTNSDCGAVVVPTNPDTSIEKELTAESIEENTIAEIGETLTYQIKVTNNDADLIAKDVAVRDSLVEAIAADTIDYLSFDGFTISPDTITYTGTLEDGNLVIDEVPAGETITIEYDVTVISLPSDVLEVDNIATDTPGDPTDPETCTDEGDCSEIVVPTNPDTVIEKSVVDANGDKFAQEGEVLTYTIRVYNNSDLPTASIPVKDSLVQGIANGTITGLTFNEDTTITGVTYDASAEGSLEDGSYLINSIPAGNYAEITYTVTVDEIGDDIASVINLATDNGTDPETLTPEECELDTTNCDSTITPVDPETTITKTVTDGDDNIVQTGDEITYTITVTNPNTVVDAQQVVVRDSLLENLPSYLTFVSEEVTPDTLTTTGSLTTSGITIEELPAGSSATITVKVIATEIPNDVESILNIVTDNGQDPTDPEVVDPEVCVEPEDCDTAVIPVEPETVIKKAISNETGSEDGIIENGETIEYTISVNNPGANSAYAVAVRDSLVENLPAYASYDGNLVLTVDGTELVLDTDYTGDLSTSDLVINEIKAGETVEITYSITFDIIPNDVSEIGNLAVDTDVDPTDPDVVDPETCDQTGEFADDCSEVVVPVHPETIITKTADAGDDNLIQEGEEVLYTITIENPSVVDAKDVQVIDSLLADLPTYMEVTTPIVISEGTNELVLDTDYTGDLMSASGIIINTIEAGGTITITYGLTLNDVPASGVIDIANVVTDNGEGITDPELCEDDSEDCSEVVIPVDPDTTITKEITNESIENDNQAQQGEELTYTIVVTNPTDADAIDIEVRDSILANLPSYLTLVGDITIDPATLETTGDLTTGDFVIANLPANSSVTITYTLLVGDVPSDLAEIENIATDNGEDPTTVDPETCSPDGTSEDCATEVIPTNPETVIKKAKTDESIDVNGIAEPGETITYEIRVTNNNDALSALDIPVRDSLIEAIKNGDYPDYTYNGITSTTPDPLASNGDLELGTFTIDSIAPGETVVIEYTVTLADPVTQTDKFIGNIVTDNGEDPVGICPPRSEDCAQVIVPKEPDTIITKSVTDANDDNIAQQGEILTYTVTLENTTLIPAENVHVRDSLVEAIEAGEVDYLELVDGSFTVDPEDTILTGDGEKGFSVDHIDAGEVITFTYQVKVLDIPDNVEEVINIVTDDGQEPTECTEISSDCSGTITPLEPETVIEKTVTDSNGDGAVQTGEELTYEIEVTNTHDTLAALNVEVRDSIIENLPDYMTLVSESYEPADLTATGTLATGGITFDQIPADTTVVITVVVTVDEIPTDLVEILNVVTDNGVDPDTVDPETCLPDDETAEDCGTAVIPVDPETVIEKTVTDSNGDGTVEDNDTLTYTIDVTNPGANTALDVEVRDSLVEEIAAGKYDWLTYGADLTITIDGTDLVLSTDYTGDLSSSDLVINEIPAGATATITFTINVGIIPDGIEEIANVVTDNGDEVIDPDTGLPITCPEGSEDCDDAVIDANPETVISKVVTVSGEDQIASIGDDLTFTIAIENPEDIDALNIPVKDSLLPTLPNEFAELKGDIVLTNGSDTLVLDTDYTGDLQTADGIVINNIPAGTTVEITYTITMIDVPTDLETVINVATDDGTDVIDPDTGLPIEVCPDGEVDDCASTITPVDPETLIEKEIIAQDGADDNYFEENETVTYQITVTNPGANTAVLVEVRDSLIEAIEAGKYDYLSVSNVVIADSAGTPLISGDDFTGSLQTSDLVINAIAAGDYITITYDVTSEEFPNDSVQVGNLVTDDGSEPTDITDPTVDPEVVCPEDSEDCATTVTPIEPETTIEKSLDSESIEEDGIAEIGEEITFKLAVTNNNTEVSAHDVAVRDSLVEQIEDGAAVADYIDNVGFTVQPDGTDFTGTLEGKDLVITEIEAGQIVNIYVTFKITDVPEGVFTFENIASDNGLDPTDPETCTDIKDCSNVVTPLNPETVIEKSVVVDGEDQIASIGDTLTFTVNVANPSSYDAANVEVKDSLVEGIKNGDYPYLDLTGTIDAVGNTFDVETSGDLTLGSYVIEEIPAGMNVDITYQVEVLDIPTDVANVINVATDDGTDVIDPDTGLPIEVCPEGTTDDCATTVTPVDPETLIEKEASISGDDNFASTGEDITYTISVTNPNEEATAVDVIVRDSMLETLEADYPYLSFVSEEVTPATLSTSGSLLDSGITIAELEAGQTATITVALHVDSVPNDVSEILNIVTDNGQDPTDPDLCDEGSEDCDSVTEPVDADTKVEKSIISESIENDGMAEKEEILTYMIKVTNENYGASAYDVSVKDSMYQDMPSELELTSEFIVNPSNVDYTGDLADGSLVLDEVAPGQTVTITYQVKVNVINESSEFVNIATDDGQDPTDPDFVCDEDSEDCAEVVEPIKPDTTIEKSIIDETIYVDNMIEDGETITYRLTVENISSVDSLDTPVRDNVLEALDTPEYSWLTLGNVTVSPEDTNYSGSLEDGTFVVDVPALSTVTIDYELTAGEVPSEEKAIENIATDDGSDPALCSPIIASISDDCSIHLSLLEADTSILKNAYDENNNGVIEDGETVRYSLTVTNYTNIAAIDTAVRDSLLENLPEYATAELIAINDTHGTDYVEGTDYTGNLVDGDMVINRIARRDSVSIIYDITFDVIPDDVTEIANYATVDGNEPTECEEDDTKCSEVIFPVEGDTTIDKAIASEDGLVDGVIEEGETVTYQLTIENPSENKAVFINVRDTMLENMPEYATLSSDIVIEPAVAATGELQSGDYTITAMEPGDVVTITYDITFNDIPDDVLEITNSATDNGTEVDPETCPLPMKASRTIISDDCAYVTEPAEGDTTITKALIDETLAIDGLAELGEQLTYELTITNEMDKDAYLVPVRDSLIENLPSWLSIDSITIGSDDYTGNLEDGTLVLEQVAANSSVVITYVLVVEEVAKDETEIANIATDDGQDPSVIDPEVCAETADDCGSVVVPLDGDTTIEKNILSTNEVYAFGDTIEYQLVVTNYTATDAYNVMIHDSLLEDTPAYLEYNKDIKVKGSTSIGDVESGTYALEVVPANSSAYITYSLDLISVPDTDALSNIATDDGSEPIEEKEDDNTDYVVVEVDPTIDEAVTDEDDADEDGTIAMTGGSSMFILIDLVLILIVSMVLRKRLS